MFAAAAPEFSIVCGRHGKWRPTRNSTFEHLTDGLVTRGTLPNKNKNDIVTMSGISMQPAQRYL
jgi:hypothetical protein